MPEVDDIAVLPGAAELLRALADASVPTAIVTSGTRDLAEARIAATGLVHPPVVGTACDVATRKAGPGAWVRRGSTRGCTTPGCRTTGSAGSSAASRAALAGSTALATHTSPRAMSRTRITRPDPPGESSASNA